MTSSCGSLVGAVKIGSQALPFKAVGETDEKLMGVPYYEKLMGVPYYAMGVPYYVISIDTNDGPICSRPHHHAGKHKNVSPCKWQAESCHYEPEPKGG